MMTSRGKSVLMASLKRRRERQALSPEFWMEACLDPDGFEKKFISRFKGFGVFSKKLFEKGDFLLEYVGELLQGQNILQRHLQHEVSTRRLVRRGRIPRHYMFHFKYNGKKMCLDATQYKDRLGQFVNDTKEGLASCNARMKLSSYKCRPRLLLYAARDIQIGEEISFDYGDENNLWWRREGLVGSNHAESPDICPEVSDVHPSTAPGVVRSDHEESPDICPEVSDVHPSTAPGFVRSDHEESPDICPEVSDVHPSTAPGFVRSDHEESPDICPEVSDVHPSTAPGFVRSDHEESPDICPEVSDVHPSTAPGVVRSNHEESPDICPEVSDVHPSTALDVVRSDHEESPDVGPEVSYVHRSTAPGVVRSDHEETPDFCPEVSDVHPSTAPDVVRSQHVESPDISPEVSDVHPSTAPDVVRSQHEDSLDTGIEVYVVLQSTAPGSVSSHHESPYEGQEVSVELPSTGLAFVQPNLDISVPASCDEDSDSNSITYPYLDKVVNEADSTSNAQSEVSQVQTVSAVRQGKNDYSKQHACLFCGKLDFKITRHMCTWHKNEREIALLPSVSKNKHSDEFHKRERALDRLRNQGDFMYNIRQLQSGGGPLIIARRQEAGRHLAADYLPCQYCLKFYVKSELWRHARKCKSVPISTNDQESSHIKASRALLFGAGVYDKGKCSEFYQHVVESMNHDETGETVRKDLSIIRVGQVLYGRLGRQRAAEVRYRLRLLGRLKCELVQDILKRNQNQLSTFIKPEHFNNIVEAVKQMVRISSEKSLNGVIMFDKPETAKKIGQLVKRLAEHKQGLAIKERSNSDRQDAIDFLTLYETEWKDTIGSIASQTTKERRFNKKDMLPLTEDLVKLRRYCDKMVNEYSVLLRQDTNIQNWRKLANITLCKVQLFNFRRGNECSKMLKEKYETRADWRQCNEEIFKSLDKVECELAKRMDLVEIMGKKDRKVPVLLTPSIRDALDLLNQTRGDVEIPVSNPYVFAKGLENYIKGSEALNTVLNMVPDLQFPEYIRFPKMRKYLATVVQIYGLSEIELQEVARHLGHELSVHRQYYRLQDDVIELAKISKLLLAVEAGKAHQFAGKSFEDIDIDCLLDIDETDEKTDGIDENVAETESVESMVVDLNQEYPGAVRNLKTAREPLQVQDLQKARTYQFEDEDLDDSVKDPSYTEEMSDSESGDDGCSKQRKTASKKKWSNLERMALQPLVVAAVRERKPPRKHQIQKLQQNSFLKDINWLKLKHQVWAIAQTQLKKASKTQSVV